VRLASAPRPSCGRTPDGLAPRSSQPGSHQPASQQHRIEMNKQKALARREEVKQSSLTVQERMRICKNRCAAMERKQLRQQRRSATNHQPYGTYRITDGSPVANTTPPSSPSPVVTTALNLNDIISHRDIGNLIMNECGVLSLGRLQITNKAIRSTITRDAPGTISAPIPVYSRQKDGDHNLSARRPVYIGRKVVYFL
jgi:hypothetical protein